MVGLMDLWLPIVLSAVLVFIASSIIHMVLPFHRKDVARLPGEERILEAMRAENVTRGSYMFPYCASPQDMGLPETKAKFDAGPVGIVHVLPSGPPNMGKHLTLWFLYTLLVSLFAAYVTGRVLGADAYYLTVFRVIGTTAFMAYGLSEFSAYVWKGQSGAVTFRHTVDGLVYALLTAGTFGWLWP